MEIPAMSGNEKKSQLNKDKYYWDSFSKFRIRINMLLALIPCTALLIFINDILFKSKMLSFVVVALSFLFGLYLLLKCGGLRCPRCHNFFFIAWFTFPTSKCLHCGLPIHSK